MSDGVDQLVCRAARQAFASAASSIHFSFWIGLPVRPMDAWHEDVMVVISHPGCKAKIGSWCLGASCLRDTFMVCTASTAAPLEWKEVVPFPSGKTNHKKLGYATAADKHHDLSSSFLSTLTFD